MNLFDDKHNFIRETHKPFTPLPAIHEERATKQKWRPMSMREVFIAHHTSSSTKRHFKKRHDDSSTKSTAAQNTNRHLENTESTPRHQDTPPKLTHQSVKLHTKSTARLELGYRFQHLKATLTTTIST
jgi:hypothetical protein